MLKIEDIRVGNKIKRKSVSSICTVNWGIIKDIEYNEGYDYDGILLNDDLLIEVLNFSKEESYYFQNDDLFPYYLFRRSYCGFYTIQSRVINEVNVMPYRMIISDRPMFYLHQLQNIICDLSGKKLDCSKLNTNHL